MANFPKFLETGRHPVIIISRHEAAVKFIREQLGEFVADAPVLQEASAADCTDRIVVGNVPLHLAAVAHTVIAIEFTGPAPRGAEYTLEQMKTAGAMLAAYRVKQIAKVQMRTLDGILVARMSGGTAPPDISDTKRNLAAVIDMIIEDSTNVSTIQEYAPYKERLRNVDPPLCEELRKQARRQALTGEIRQDDWMKITNTIDSWRFDCDEYEE